MIRFRLAELMSDAQFKTGHRVTIKEISESTGINRVTLSRMANVRGYSTSTDTIDKLCAFFGCDVSDVAQYVSAVPAAERGKAPKAKGPTNGTARVSGTSPKARAKKTAG